MEKNNQLFNDCLKICAFRAITDQLLERHLITEEEYGKISQRLVRMEAKLVAEKPSERKTQRSVAVVKQPSLAR